MAVYRCKSSSTDWLERLDSETSGVWNALYKSWTMLTRSLADASAAASGEDNLPTVSAAARRHKHRHTHAMHSDESRQTDESFQQHVAEVTDGARSPYSRHV